MCQLSIVYKGIYLLYTWYIHGIFQSYVDVIQSDTDGGYIRSKTFLGLLCTFFYNDIPLIFHEYSFDIQITSKAYYYKKWY